MRAFVCVVVIGLMAMTSEASAGAFATCDPAPTEADAVAGADLVVVARAAARTRRTGPDGLTTSFVIVETLKGKAPRARIVVTSCTHWKCAGGRWRRGERALLIVRSVGRGRYALVRGGCGNGFTSTWLTDDAADPHVQAVRAAALASAAP